MLEINGTPTYLGNKKINYNFLYNKCGIDVSLFIFFFLRVKLSIFFNSFL